MRDPFNELQIAIEHGICRVIAIRFHLENERHRNMSRLTEKLKLAGEVVGRQTAKIEARADAILAREPLLEHQTDQAFSPHEALLDEAEQGVDALGRQLMLLSNNPPLEHSTPLPGGPRVLPDGPAGVGDLNLPGPVGTRVALGPHPDQPEGLLKGITHGEILTVTAEDEEAQAATFRAKLAANAAE